MRFKIKYISGSLDWNRISKDSQASTNYLEIHHKNVPCEILYISMEIPKAQLQNPKDFSLNILFYCPFDFAKTTCDFHEKTIELHEKHTNLHEKQVWISRGPVEAYESSEISRSRF